MSKAAEEKMNELREERFNASGNPDELKWIGNRTVEILKDEYDAVINNADACILVVDALIRATAELLNERKTPEENVVINITDLISIGVSYRPSDDGEKEGNYTPIVMPRPKLKTFFKSDDDTEEND